jgi:hypothetical protein
MRKSFMFIFGLAAFALVPHDVMGEVKLTAQQVETVCGKTPGNSGCSKKCGLNNEHTCDFGCNPPDQCRGLCTTCGVKERRVFPNRYSNRVTRASLALPVRAGYRARRPTYCEWCYELPARMGRLVFAVCIASHVADATSRSDPSPERG